MNESLSQTWHAPARRSTTAELDHEIGLLTNNPVTDALLRTVDGLLAIIDENRQILAVNDTYLTDLGFESGAELVGLRHGEALGCVHADEGPNGCGTSKACVSCGTVNAVLEAQRTNEPVSRMATLATRPGDERHDLALQLRICPFPVKGERFFLVFMQDVTQSHRLANLERSFLHDINNLLQGLQISADLAAVETEPEESRILGRHIQHLVGHFNREIELQRMLVEDDVASLRQARDNVPLARIRTELQRVFRFHPAGQDRFLEFAPSDRHTWVRTDAWILVRVLSNLVLNALEATPPGGRVEVQMTATDADATITVWNREPIPEHLQPRIFQRNFSTKEGRGRGLGTYAVRQLGESLLGGEISFTSSPTAGTEFRVVLPR